MVERTTLRALLRQAPYRRLWTARTVSQWGDAFNTVALALLVYSLTGSGLGVSGVVIAEIIPVLVLAPFAGALVDRLSRVRVMIGADLARAALAFLLPFVDSSVVAVYAIAVGLSAGAVFFNPATQSVVPAVVAERDLVAANSGLWTADVVSQIALAPLAGVVVAAFGYSWAFWINAASYLVSAAMLKRLAVPAAPTAVTAPSPWYADVREGISLLGRQRLLRALAAGQFLAALSAGATGALLVVLAREHLGIDARDYGLLLGAIGVGAATGPLLLWKLTDNPRHPGYVFGPFVLRAVVDAVLATVTGLAASIAALIGYGIGTSTGAVTFNSLLQAETAERLRETDLRQLRHALADRAFAVAAPGRAARRHRRDPRRLLSRRRTPPRRSRRRLVGSTTTDRHTSSPGVTSFDCCRPIGPTVEHGISPQRPQ